MEVNASRGSGIVDDEDEKIEVVTKKYQTDEVKSSWFKRICRNYNKVVLLVICLQYFNAATRLLVMQGIDKLLNRVLPLVPG